MGGLPDKRGFGVGACKYMLEAEYRQPNAIAKARVHGAPRQAGLCLLPMHEVAALEASRQTTYL